MPLTTDLQHEVERGGVDEVGERDADLARVRVRVRVRVSLSLSLRVRVRVRIRVGVRVRVRVRVSEMRTCPGRRTSLSALSSSSAW